MKKLLILLMAGAATLAFAATQSYEDEVADRLKPAGNVCVQGKTCETATASAGAAVAAGPRSGSDVYSLACAACHNLGILGAPKIAAPADWTVRLEKGTDALYANAINGINAMPAKGGNMSLSDEEVAAAVDHMLSTL